MLRLRAFRPTAEKVVRLQLHPTHPWLVTADANDNVVVWDWEHRQVVYEFNAGRVDEKRLVGAQLQKRAEGDSESKEKPTEAIRGGSVKQIKFYDDDVRFWQAWLNRVSAAEAPVAVNQQFGSLGGVPAVRGRHFLVICCENKAIFLDLVTMRGRDATKQLLENKAPICVEFLPRSSAEDGPFAAFGGSDGIIRVLSMNNWQIIQRYVGGHKGAVSCLITFVASSGETLLVSGSSDGFVVVWNGENPQVAREVSPKLSIKAHDGGVTDIQMARVQGGAPQLITIGADKTLAIWDTVSFKELRRVKPVSKVACQSVASWCHPRAPNLDILICVKDSHIWAIEHATYTAMTRDLCDLSSQIPAVLLGQNKKLKAYCMTVHPLQPHLVATGTNLGVILSEFDAKSIPAAAALPSPSGSKEHDVVFMAERELRLLTFQLSGPNDQLAGASSGVEAGRLRSDLLHSAQLHVKQARKKVASAPYDSYSLLSVSGSGKHVAVVWPDASRFTIYRVSDWSTVDTGSAKYFAWDSCKERYALLETVQAPKILPVAKGGSSRRAREAAAQAAAVAAAAAANAATSATVEVRILLEDGSSNLLRKGIEGRSEQVIGLQGGALLGVAYKMFRGSTVSHSAFGIDDGSSSFGGKSSVDTQANFQLYSWESSKAIGGLLPQPEWSAWDQTVEYCAFAYQRYIVIASLRPQYRYLGNVAIESATGGVWHRRQLFIATPTSIECVFVDAGVSSVDVETKKRKEEEKMKAAQAKAVTEQGALALLTVDAPQATTEEKVALRPPMLQVVRLASFQTAPSVPPFLPGAKQLKGDGDIGGSQKDVERKANDNSVAGGGISVAVSRLPVEQKRPVGPLVVVGVRDGVLWLVDRYMTAHAIGLSHPGIRCRCLAAYGDAVSAVKWASRLGREHHDDFAQFMLGMGYATEALHLPGISKRLEYELAMQSGDLKRAFQCLTTLSNSKTIGQEIDLSTDATGILALTTKEKKLDAVQGIASFSAEFIKLVDAADATAQSEMAGEALKKLTAAGTVVGALQKPELKGLALRLANHGEMTRLAMLVNTMISAGNGREAALAAALLGDPSMLEKAWQNTNMVPEAALHAHAHGRPTLKVLLEQWNALLQKEHNLPSNKHPASAPASSIFSPQKNSIMQNLSEPEKKVGIEVVPPGVVKVSSATSVISARVSNPQTAGTVQEPSQPSKPLMIEAAPLVSI